MGLKGFEHHTPCRERWMPLAVMMGRWTACVVEMGGCVDGHSVPARPMHSQLGVLPPLTLPMAVWPESPHTPLSLDAHRVLPHHWPVADYLNPQSRQSLLDSSSFNFPLHPTNTTPKRPRPHPHAPLFPSTPTSNLIPANPSRHLREDAQMNCAPRHIPDRDLSLALPATNATRLMTTWPRRTRAPSSKLRRPRPSRS